MNPISRLILSVLFALGVTFAVGGVTANPPVHNYQLVNQEGKPFQLYDLKGQFVLVSWVYSRCPMPKMCPLTMTLSNQLVRKWKEAKDLKDKPLQILAVTLDPAYDTPPVLKKFGQQHHVDFKRFTLATGVPKTLDSFAAEFNVIGFPSDGMISHNMKNVLIGPDLVPLAEYKENEWKPEDVLKVMRVVKMPAK